MADTELGDNLRALLHAGSAYLEGNSTLSALNGHVGMAKDAVKVSGKSHPAIGAMLDEWGATINRRWNEWGMEREPLSEDEFRLWLRSQLDRTELP